MFFQFFLKVYYCTHEGLLGLNSKHSKNGTFEDVLKSIHMKGMSQPFDLGFSFNLSQKAGNYQLFFQTLCSTFYKVKASTK